MNREMRRAAKHQAKHKPPRTKVLNAHQCLLDLARPYEPGEMIKEHNLTWAAYIRLRDGGGDKQDFNRVSMRLNIVRVRAEDIDPELAQIICAGQEAMQRMKDRHERGLSFGLDADGLVTVPAAMQAHETITDASSPLQMHEAARTVYRAFRIGAIHTKEGFLCPV